VSLTDMAPHEIYTLSLHAALLISPASVTASPPVCVCVCVCVWWETVCAGEIGRAHVFQSHLNLVCRLLLEKNGCVCCVTLLCLFVFVSSVCATYVVVSQ